MRKIGAALVGPYSAKVYKSGNQSIPNAAATALTFDTVAFNNGTLYAAGTPSRLTAPVAGRYVVVGKVQFSVNATGRRGADLMKNGATLLESVQFQPLSGASATAFQVFGIVSLEAGDYLELRAYQDSTAALDVNGGNQFNTSFSMCLQLGQ